MLQKKECKFTLFFAQSQVFMKIKYTYVDVI